jgi:hypothetical protein
MAATATVGLCGDDGPKEKEGMKEEEKKTFCYFSKELTKLNSNK